MQFIGTTALIDAVISLIALLILMSRKNRMQADAGRAESVGYFTKYLTYTFLFLALLGSTLLWTTGTTMATLLFVSDLLLWVSLAYMVAFAFQGGSRSTRNTLIWVLIIVGLLRSAYQLAGILGANLALPGGLVYILSNLDLWLMYVVWVPTALYFIIISLTSQNSVARGRSLMFGIGLLLITFTWAFRTLSTNPSLMVVSVVSVIGFALMLWGVIYKGQTQVAAVA